MATVSPRGPCTHRTQNTNCVPEDDGSCGKGRVATRVQSSGEQILEDSEPLQNSIVLKGKAKKVKHDLRTSPGDAMKRKGSDVLILSNSPKNNSNSDLAPGCGVSSCAYLPSSHSPVSCLHKANVEVSLEGKSLWEEFCRRGTEMIVNRSGRRMFPGFSVAISNLKPKVKYNMKLEVVLADNHRFKFLNSKWLAVGSAEPQAASESYLHPDSPNSGAFWMRHGVSFRKLKITNNKEKPGSNALLYSMHKYYLRLLVEEESRTMTTGARTPSRVVTRLSFPETTFIAVTAYQNEEVTHLKITNNPFAKAFRENTADVDWETAQMLYSGQGNSTYHPTDHLGGPLLASGGWPLPTPILSSPGSHMTSPAPPFMASTFPLSLTRTNLTCSPSYGAGSYSSTGMFGPYSSPYSCPHHFQWPLPPPISPPLTHYGQESSSQHGVAGGNTNTYYQSMDVDSSDDAANKTMHLPNFETVFTPK